MAVWYLNLFKICDATGTDFLFHGQSDGSKSQFFPESMGFVVLISFSIGQSDRSKSNRNSEDNAFLHTFPYGGGGGGGGGTENKLNDQTSLALD